MFPNFGPIFGHCASKLHNKNPLGQPAFVQVQFCLSMKLLGHSQKKEIIWNYLIFDYLVCVHIFE